MLASFTAIRAIVFVYAIRAHHRLPLFAHRPHMSLSVTFVATNGLPHTLHVFVRQLLQAVCLALWLRPKALPHMEHLTISISMPPDAYDLPTIDSLELPLEGRVMSVEGMFCVFWSKYPVRSFSAILRALQASHSLSNLHPTVNGIRRLHSGQRIMPGGQCLGLLCAICPLVIGINYHPISGMPKSALGCKRIVTYRAL